MSVASTRSGESRKTQSTLTSFSKNEDGATLKDFLRAGGRWHQLMSNLEAGVGPGPYYFGDSPSCVDFFIAHHVDIRCVTLFGPLSELTGEDHLSAYPKIKAIYEVRGQ